MFTMNRLRGLARYALHCWQARRLLARINRRQAMGQRPAESGYDELSNPVFLGVIALAVAVLIVDVADAWPTTSGASGSVAVSINEALLHGSR